MDEKTNTNKEKKRKERSLNECCPAYLSLFGFSCSPLFTFSPLCYSYLEKAHVVFRHSQLAQGCTSPLELCDLLLQLLQQTLSPELRCLTAHVYQLRRNRETLIGHTFLENRVSIHPEGAAFTSKT